MVELQRVHAVGHHKTHLSNPYWQQMWGHLMDTETILGLQGFHLLLLAFEAVTASPLSMIATPSPLCLTCSISGIGLPAVNTTLLPTL